MGFVAAVTVGLGVIFLLQFLFGFYKKQSLLQAGSNQQQSNEGRTIEESPSEERLGEERPGEEQTDGEHIGEQHTDGQQITEERVGEGQPSEEQPGEERGSRYTNTCLLILNGICIRENGSKNELTPEESRGKPNKRLVTAFGVDNAFTTSNEEYRIVFRKYARIKLGKIVDARWKGIAEIASKLVHQKIEGERSQFKGEGMSLVPFVQTITLSISLHVLFGLDPHGLEEELVSLATEEINKLWIASKKDPMDADTVAERKTSLEDALRKLSPDFDFTPQATPLNYILPAYETMWRIVLHTFIEVSFRDAPLAFQWRETLQLFLNDPTKQEFIDLPKETQVSVEFMVQEALRLYPPTRRVHREFKFAETEKSIILKADIEKCHRDESVWGSDSKRFLPSRWNKLDDEAHKSFMPFGGGEFRCPARHSFGPRMIGVLVAVFAGAIPSDEWRITESGGAGTDVEWAEGPLESGREAYGSLKLEKIV